MAGTIYHAEPRFLQTIPQSEFVLTLLLILFVGILYELMLKDILHKIEMSIFKKIPLVSLIYFGVKRIASALTTQ